VLTDSRTGEVDGGCDALSRCASGDYRLDLNVALQQADDLDPRLQLRDRFFAWRYVRIGHTDHYRSTVAFAADTLPADGMSTTLLARSFGIGVESP
jgi:hypothetical protein